MKEVANSPTLTGMDGKPIYGDRKVMRVLVACEFSGVVREAFAKKGHDAYSIDLLPGEGWLKDYKHIRGYVQRLFDDKKCIADGLNKWDLMIAHPPCTYLTVANSRNFIKYAAEQKEAISFVEWLWQLPIPKICIENPIGVLSTKSILGKPKGLNGQIIQPNQFGEDASKSTCLWLKNLPRLTATKLIAPRIINGKPRWGNQTDSGQNKLTPSATRAQDRSRTYKGIAEAMAEQWG